MRRESGLTLVEAAVAIAVAGILAGILVPLVMKSLRDARIARARADLKVIAAAIASQLKDTGCRPRVLVPGLNAANGGRRGVWYSGGTPVRLYRQVNNQGPWQPGGLIGANHPGNTFTNLFTPGPSDPVRYRLANALFEAAPANHSGQRYRGPYLTLEAARKTDPGGRGYVILGYNRLCEQAGGRLYVVCAGESGGIIIPNLASVESQAHYRPWRYEGPSATNLVVEVN